MSVNVVCVTVYVCMWGGEGKGRSMCVGGGVCVCAWWVIMIIIINNNNSNNNNNNNNDNDDNNHNNKSPVLHFYSKKNTSHMAFYDLLYCTHLHYYIWFGPY